MVIKKLEELLTWIEARKLAGIVYPLLNKLPGDERFILRKHLWECIRNIPGNIAEGFGRYHAAESIQFYRIARGSANEAKSDAYICFDCGYWTQQDLKMIINQIDKVIGFINGLIASTRKLKNFVSPANHP